MYSNMQHYWYELADAMRDMPFGLLEQVAELLLACHQRDGIIYVVGNGGSAATASHFTCDLMKGTRAPGIPSFRVISLSDNIPLLTAWANDSSYERVFVEPFVSLARPGDMVMLISVSGNSPNVLAVASEARQRGITVIGLTGPKGGKLAAMSDLVICSPAQTMEQIEDMHSIIAHSLCVAVRERLKSAAVLTAVMPEKLYIEGVYEK